MILSAEQKQKIEREIRQDLSSDHPNHKPTYRIAARENLIRPADYRYLPTMDELREAYKLAAIALVTLARNNDAMFQQDHKEKMDSHLELIQTFISDADELETNRRSCAKETYSRGVKRFIMFWNGDDVPLGVDYALKNLMPFVPARCRRMQKHIRNRIGFLGIHQPE